MSPSKFVQESEVSILTPTKAIVEVVIDHSSDDSDFESMLVSPATKRILYSRIEELHRRLGINRTKNYA